MKIRKRLTLNTWISLGIIAIMAISLAWSFTALQRVARDKTLAAEIQRVAMDRAAHRDYYLHNGTDRALYQWQTASGTLKILMESASSRFTDEESQALLREAWSCYRATVTIFSEIVAIYRQDTTPTKRIASNEAESRIRQLYLKHYTMQGIFERLSESTNRAETKTQNVVGLLLASVIMFGMFITGYNSSALSRLITKRLMILNDGLVIIGQGKLDYQIDMKGDDELADLTRSINAMTAKLHQAYQDLESEIGQREQAEEAIRKLNDDLTIKNEQLGSSNRELEAFIYSVSHDLRQPLRAIASFAQIVGKGLREGLADREKGYLTRIVDNAAKMSHLIESMLKLSRISRQEIKRERIDLSRMAEAVVSGIHEAHPERCTEIAIGDGLFAVADEGLMAAVLENLIGNACKFTAEKEKARVEFGAALQDGQPVFFVRDNGAGFDPAYVENLFKPFHRLHSENEFAGTGIGLSIVERIIGRHGGRVWAEGDIGKGAAFFFTLPPPPPPPYPSTKAM